MATSSGLRTRVGLVAAVSALSLYPPLLSISEGGLERIFNYFAADAFYYLAVAKHAATFPVPTFDGVHPTNGFHPLWQGVLWILGRFGGLSAESLVGWSFSLCLVATSIGSVLFSLGVLRATSNFWLALFATVPGYFYWMFSALDPRHFASWAIVNGMESGFSCLFFGALVFLLLAPAEIGHRSTLGTRQVLIASLLVTGVVLSRLDDVFYFPPFVAFIGYASRGQPCWRRNVATSVAIPALVIASYLLFNRAYAGQFLPISGTMKSDGIVAFLRNLGDPLVALAPPLGDLIYGRSSAEIWGKSAAKVLALLLPGLASSALLWRAQQKREAALGLASANGVEAVVSLLAIGALCKTLFNFVSIGMWHQGTWYFTTNLMTLHLFMAWALSVWGKRTELGGLNVNGTARALLGAFAFTILWIQAGAFGKAHADPAYHAHYSMFWKERKTIDAELTRVAGGSGVLSYDDGIVAFSLNRSVMSGLGFSLDVEAAQEKRSGNLLGVAYQRGVRILASVNYFPELRSDLSSDEIRRALRRGTSVLKWERLDEWDFTVLELKGVSYGRFIAFVPHQGPQSSTEDQQVARAGAAGVSDLWRKLLQKFSS